VTFTADSLAVNMQHLFLSSSTILKLRTQSTLLDLSSIVVVSHSLLTKTGEIVEFLHRHRPTRLPMGYPRVRKISPAITVPVPAEFTTQLGARHGPS